MPFPMKIQPIDSKGMVRSDQAKPPAKSKLKRLFEWQFPGVLRTSPADRLDSGADLEPSSVCLDKMVRNFMEGGSSSNERPFRCGRSRCNCFHGTCEDVSDDALDFSHAREPPIVSAASGDAAEVVNGLALCASLTERNLLAEALNIMDRNRVCKRKEECIKAVTAGLRCLGYDASICKSRLEKTPSFPAGEYEYIDVVIGRERLLVDVDFRSEFEIARSTKSYRAVLQSLPTVFVGAEERVDQIVAVVSGAARLSMKKKGLDFPPWRRREYMRAKWLSPYTRSTPLKPKRETIEEEGSRDLVDGEGRP